MNVSNFYRTMEKDVKIIFTGANLKGKAKSIGFQNVSRFFSAVCFACVSRFLSRTWYVTITTKAYVIKKSKHLVINMLTFFMTAGQKETVVGISVITKKKIEMSGVDESFCAPEWYFCLRRCCCYRFWSFLLSAFFAYAIAFLFLLAAVGLSIAVVFVFVVVVMVTVNDCRMKRHTASIPQGLSGSTVGKMLSLGWSPFPLLSEDKSTLISLFVNLVV